MTRITLPRPLAALSNWFGSGDYALVPAEDLIEMRRLVVQLREGIERSAAAGRTTQNVRGMAGVACRKLEARLAYFEPLPKEEAS